MSISRNLIVAGVCAATCSQAQALLSVNVLQDNTTVPGWVINTFTVDSDRDLTAAVALSELTSGSMLQVPGFFPNTKSNGTGDSYVSINNDPNTNSGLGVGDLTRPSPPPPTTFDSTGIAMTWFNTGSDDIGLGMHLMTLTFSNDAFGTLGFLTTTGGGSIRGSFDITSGIASPGQMDIFDPPIDTNPLPDPDPAPDPGTGGNTNPGTGLPGNPGPDGRTNPIPEPAGLALLGVCAAMFGGLHRRRLVERAI